MSKFAHLHQHTSYSLLDGLSNVKDLLKWVKDTSKSDPSCAITDHGTMGGVAQFYRHAIELGVKPVIGYEAYITAGSRHVKQKGEKTYHLTLLARDFEGYQNLCRLNYLANSEGYYYKPRIDHEILEQHSKGVIAMSGCLGAELQQHILNGDIDAARSTIEWYLKVFKDNYFIEIQNHGLPEQALVNPILMQLAKEYGVGMVATNDGHYVKKSDSDTHDTLLAIQTKSRTSDEGRFKFPCDEFYIKSIGEMELFLPRSTWGDEVYDNTVLISQMCNVELPIGSKKTYRIPSPKLQEGDTSDAKIYRLVNKGLRKRYGADLTADKIKRAEYELSVIKKIGFVDYFLIVQDYVNWGKKQGIAVGLGRGSGAGSIVAYAIGITDIDPMKFGLIFERFLNPDRVSMADFDIDWSDTGREKVIAYVREKYGEDHVSMIGTYGAMLSRSCLKDVARSMGIPHDTVNTLTGMIPVKFGKPSTLMEAYESSQEIRDFLDLHEDVKRAYYYALNLEGTIRSSGVHASGLIISNAPLTDLIPLTVDRTTGKSVSQFDMHDVEDLGLVKMDFLGLRTLTFLEKARDLLLQHKGISVLFNDLPLDDPKVYKLLSRGDNKGIFQLEGSGISQASKGLKPERFQDIVALTSLYRPGPMDNIGTYIKRRHGLEEISYKDFPQSSHLLMPILEETYGIPVYQEQIMHISTSVAGYTLAESDMLRRALDVETEIPTPNGWVKLDDIQVGDHVFGSDGMATEVLEIHDVGVSDDIYEVRFSDGSSIVADGDHLWTVTTSLQRRRNKDRVSIESAKEELQLIRQFKKLRSEGKSWNEIARQFGIKCPETIARRIKNEQRLERRLTTEIVVSTRVMSETLYHRGERNWHIKLPQAIEYQKVNLPLDPYFVGLWIGDGTSKSSTFTTKDQEIVDYMRNLGYSIRHKPYTGAQYGYYVADENGIGITTALKRYGVCSRKFGKRIPDIYMRASVADRWELLKGIVDTDGTVDKKTGRISISSSNKHLAYQYLELARSLGVKAFILESDAILNGRNYGRTWDVGFMCEFYPGRLQRKAKAWRTPLLTKDRAVVEITKVAPRRAKCITVAANDHLFVAGRDYILTHNCMGKKSQYEMDKQRAKFIDGAKSTNNIDSEEAERLFELLNKFANYGFNKCAHAQTRVMLADGSQISLSRAYREQPRELMAMWSDGTVRPHAVSKIVKTGVKELLKIRTKSGRVIKVTPEHRLLTTRGYIEAREMTLSDELITLPRVSDKQRAARRANMTKLNQSVTQREKVSERMIRYQAGRSMEDKVSHMRHMHMIHPDLTRNGVAAMHERIKFLWANDPEFRKRHIERSIASVRACYNTGPGYGRCSIASNGMWCASSYEREMCEWLISHGVEFEMHKVLRNGRMCDFYFDGLYWEMDGMDRTYQYFADKYGDLPFIVVTPEDYKAIVAKHLGLEHTENGDLIVSIEPCESAMTYDIEMMPNGPLNYIANGIVSHNSHAVAYSMLSYQTAWLKANHPDIFFAALLSVEYGNQDKVAEYIQDARRYGIEILPPDINKSQREFAITDGVIYFGLSAIKSLGEGAVDAILNARQDSQFGSLIDITERIPKGDLNSRALGMLIKAGALDSLGDRSQQLASIESLRKPLPKRNPKPRQLVDDYTSYTAVELLKLERDAIGLYVSATPLDSYPEFKAARSCAISYINEWCSTQPSYFQNRVRGIVAGTVSGITKIQTKRGETMAKLLIEDETAIVEVLVFASDWAQMSQVVQMDMSALFYCDITPDDKDGSPKLVGKRIFTYDDLIWLPRIAYIDIDMGEVDTNTVESLASDFRGTTDDARGIVRIDVGGDITVLDLGDLRIDKEMGVKLGEIDGVSVSFSYDPKALLQVVGSR